MEVFSSQAFATAILDRPPHHATKGESFQLTRDA